jgi:hypothetical protein
LKPNASSAAGFASGYVDILDLAWVEDHDGPLPHPAQDAAQ